jgi:hypothetical protein
MQSKAPNSFMTLTRILHLLLMLSFISTNCTVAYFAFPAYRRRRSWAMWLLSYSSVVLALAGATIAWAESPQIPLLQRYWLGCIAIVAEILSGIAFSVGTILLVCTVDSPAAQPPLKPWLQRERDEDASNPE